MGIVKDSTTLMSNTIRYIRETIHGGAKSLPERAKPASVISRAYIDSTLADEEIMVPLMGALNQLYVGYVLTALGLEGWISEGYTIRELTQVIATESVNDSAEMVLNGLGSVNMESRRPSADPKDWEFDDDSGERDRMGRQSKPDSRGTGKSEVANLSNREQHLVAGRVVEVLIPIPSGGTIPVRVYVQLVPRLVDQQLAGGFLGLNIDTSMKKRLQKATAGEIGFWKDFVFCLDRAKYLREVLKKDRDGELKDMLNRQDNALFKHYLNLGRIETNYNTASAVLIISKEQLRRELNRTSTRLDHKTVQRFFNKSFMMMMVVVDRDHNQVDIHTHAIRGVGQYTYSEINKVGSSKQGVDLKEIMTLMSGGNTVRF